MKKKATIQDVARDTGLSTATVSRTLNEPWLVRESTLKIINESIARLGYRPNVGAQLLASGKSNRTICFLLSNRPFAHTIHAQVLQGAANQAEADKAWVLYCTCKYSPNDSPKSIDFPHILATSGLIDGIVVAGTNYMNIVPALEKIGMPYAIFGTNLIADEDKAVMNSVYTDDEGGGYIATRHLIDLGHKKICFIGDISFPWYRRRYIGYKKAAEEAGIEVRQAFGRSSGIEMEMGYTAVNEIFGNGIDFTALFVGGDEGAIGAIRALRQSGKSVPRDVSVVGFNDEQLAKISDPQLTTIRAPKEEAGSECVKMLQKIIKKPDEKIKPVVLLTELVVRESTRNL